MSETDNVWQLVKVLRNKDADTFKDVWESLTTFCTLGAVCQTF